MSCRTSGRGFDGGSKSSRFRAKRVFDCGMIVVLPQTERTSNMNPTTGLLTHLGTNAEERIVDVWLNSGRVS